MLVIVGKTASGKDTCAKYMCENLGFNKIITYTSRPMRIGESNENPYHFITREEFKQKIKDGFFFEYYEYNGWFYGTSKESIRKADDKSLIILNPFGLEKLRDSYLTRYISFYIKAREETLRNRLSERGDDKKEIERRLLNDAIDFGFIEHQTNYTVVNDGDKTIKDVAEEIMYRYKRKLGD